MSGMIDRVRSSLVPPALWLLLPFTGMAPTCRSGWPGRRLLLLLCLHEKMLVGAKDLLLLYLLYHTVDVVRADKKSVKKGDESNPFWES